VFTSPPLNPALESDIYDRRDVAQSKKVRELPVVVSGLGTRVAD
jgi:hypothetical protein